MARVRIRVRVKFNVMVKVMARARARAMVRARVKGIDSETHIWPCIHIHLDVTVRVTNQIPPIYPIISTQSSFENYAKMRLESRRLPPYLFTCDVTHSLSVESHLQASLTGQPSK